MIINDNFLIPTPLETLKALFVLGQTGQFYLAVLKSLLRIIIGYALGVTVGFLGGVIANKFPLFNDLTSPAIQVIKAVPVASFIILAGINPLLTVSTFVAIPIIFYGSLYFRRKMRRIFKEREKNLRGFMLEK